MFLRRGGTSEANPNALLCEVLGESHTPKPLKACLMIDPTTHLLFARFQISPEEKVKAVNLMGDEDSELPHRQKVRRVEQH